MDQAESGIAHTTVSSGTVSGIGDWAPSATGDWIYVEVLADGIARVISAGPPRRMFNVGWFAIGAGHPDLGGTYYEQPVWIEMDKFNYSTFFRIQPPANQIGFDTIHYELSSGVSARIDLIHFY